MSTSSKKVFIATFSSFSQSLCSSALVYHRMYDITHYTLVHAIGLFTWNTTLSRFILTELSAKSHDLLIPENVCDGEMCIRVSIMRISGREIPLLDGKLE